MPCGGPKSLKVHRYSVVMLLSDIFWAFGMEGLNFYFGTVALNPGLGGVSDVTSAIISHEQTQSNRCCCFQLDCCISKLSRFRLLYISLDIRQVCPESLLCVVWLAMRTQIIFMRTAMCLLRLDGYAGLSESSLGA